MENKKHEWYGLNAPDREKLVLELIAQGYTADQLNEYFEVKTKRVITDFMNGRGYSKRNNTFIPKQQAEGLAAAPIMPQQQNLMPNIQIDDETIFNVMNLSKQHDKIQKIIEWFDENKNNDISIDNNKESITPTEYIEVIDTSLPIPETLEGDKVDRKTFRVNYRIYDDFMDLAKRKYPEYKQQDLMTLALQMFIDKYK